MPYRTRAGGTLFHQYPHFGFYLIQVNALPAVTPSPPNMRLNTINHAVSHRDGTCIEYLIKIAVAQKREDMCLIYVAIPVVKGRKHCDAAEPLFFSHFFIHDAMLCLKVALLSHLIGKEIRQRRVTLLSRGCGRHHHYIHPFMFCHYTNSLSRKVELSGFCSRWSSLRLLDVGTEYSVCICLI
jgi:hypothetical protein